MNPAQIHLALNHAPMFLSIIGALVLLAGIFRKNDSFISLSKYLMIGAALLIIPVYLTGEGTEEIAENLPGVGESAIEAHEEMARIAMILMVITGAAALLGLFVRRMENLHRILVLFILVLSLASFGAIAQTAHLGGLIRHTELKGGNAGTMDQATQQEEEKDKDDD